MSELQVSNKFQYQELLLDSSLATLSYSSTFSSLNWPKFTFENRTLNPAAIKVVSAEIPFVFDTLCEGCNVLLVNNLPVQISAGNYSLDGLITELQTKLSGIPNYPPSIPATTTSMTVTYNDQTMKFTLTNNEPFTIDFRDIGEVGTLKNTLYKMMGFNKELYSSDGNSLTSVNVPNPSGPWYIRMNSDTIGRQLKCLLQDNNLNLNDSVLCRIPINTQRKGLICYNDSNINNFYDFVQGLSFQNMDIYFTIEDGYGERIIDFKGLSFSVRIGLLTYREGGSNISTRPSNSRYAVA
jgi:hypothetical protein